MTIVSNSKTIPFTNNLRKKIGRCMNDVTYKNIYFMAESSYYFNKLEITIFRK